MPNVTEELLTYTHHIYLTGESRERWTWLRKLLRRRR